ncbi:MAG TPA: ferritin [Ignavibacteriaceae bacterium]|nr:ferritin [Ignavibacteriaceae bacterium]
MIKDNIQKALNLQLNQELYAFYLYLSMSAYFDSKNLNGFANWMKFQAEEEKTHAMKFYDYILHANGKVDLQNITAPKKDWKTVEEVFSDTYNHEKKVTESIYDIVDLSIAEKDHATHNFLQWFVSEQVEEEATALKILEKIRFINDNQGALFILDREVGSRAAQ